MSDKIAKLINRGQHSSAMIAEKVKEGNNTIQSLLPFIDEPYMTKEQKQSELLSIIGILQTYKIVDIKDGKIVLT